MNSRKLFKAQRLLSRTGGIITEQRVRRILLSAGLRPTERLIAELMDSVPDDRKPAPPKPKRKRKGRKPKAKPAEPAEAPSPAEPEPTPKPETDEVTDG
mgnify:FL=1